MVLRITRSTLHVRMRERESIWAYGVMVHRGNRGSNPGRCVCVCVCVCVCLCVCVCVCVFCSPVLVVASALLVAISNKKCP